jgi:nucleoside-diphosphate-sugar epimerase
MKRRHMRVLITGAAGFIGSHLVSAYLRAGHRVIGADNLLTGNRRNVHAMSENQDFELLDLDVSGDISTLTSMFAAEGPPNLVLHFASPASPVDYGNHPIETLRVNSRGTEALAELALLYNAAFLYASTSEAYGDPLEHPQRETYWGNVNPIGVRSCYDESKRYGEAFVSTMVRTQGLNGRIIRIFNTYGPRMQIDDGRVVPNFVKQALKGEPLTIYGDGSQTRSFCYVDDLVEGIVRCAASDKTRGTVVNLGNPEEHSIREFAEIVCRIADVPLKIQPMPLPPDDPARRCPDISRAKELLGWEPQISLEDGLRRTITYFREHV